MKDDEIEEFYRLVLLIAEHRTGGRLSSDFKLGVRACVEGFSDVSHRVFRLYITSSKLPLGEMVAAYERAIVSTSWATDDRDADDSLPSDELLEVFLANAQRRAVLAINELFAGNLRGAIRGIFSASTSLGLAIGFAGRRQETMGKVLDGRHSRNREQRAKVIALYESYRHLSKNQAAQKIVERLGPDEITNRKVSEKTVRNILSTLPASRSGKP